MLKTGGIAILLRLALLSRKMGIAATVKLPGEVRPKAAFEGDFEVWHDSTPSFTTEDPYVEYNIGQESEDGYESALNDAVEDEPTATESSDEEDNWYNSAIDFDADESIERSPEAPDGIYYFRPYLHRQEVPKNIYYNIYRPLTDENHPGGRGKHAYNHFHIDPLRDNPFWYEQRQKQRRRRAERIKKGLPLPPELDFTFQSNNGLSDSDDDDSSDDEEGLVDEWKEIIRLVTKKADMNDEKEIERDHTRAEIMKQLLNVEKGGGAFFKDHFNDICYHPDLCIEEVKRRYRNGLLPNLKVKDHTYHFEYPSTSKGNK